MKVLLPDAFAGARSFRADDRDPTLSPSSRASLRGADLILTSVSTTGERSRDIVEVQLGIDPEKRWSWPFYVASIGAKSRANTRLVVVTLDDAIARWARMPIRWMNGCDFVPTVIGLSEIPEVVDAASASTDPIGAILSVLAHPRPTHSDRVARAVESAFEALDPDVPPYYTDVVLDALSKRAPRLLERFMPITAPPNDQIQFEPLKQLVERGVREGRLEGEARMVTRLLERKFGELPPGVRERIHASTTDELDAIADRILDARTVDDALGSGR